jgi:hypothetical protein
MNNNTMQVQPLFYTKEEVMVLFRIPLRTMDRWISQRKIPGMTRIGDKWLYRKAIIDKRACNSVFLLED